LADRAALLAELQRVRKTHIAFDREENSPGIGAVGFALRDAAGTLFAISIPMPIQRFKRMEKKLVETALLHRNKMAAKISGVR
jgi:DNA-binding IclR family transcriptional regulator